MVATSAPARTDLGRPDEWTVLGARVRWTSVPDDLPGARVMPRAPVGRLLATPDAVWFEDENVRLLVRGVDEVCLDPRAGVDRAAVAHYAYGFAASVLLLHAGRFSLHASAVRTADGAVVVVAGDSGAGKSTTCMALAQGGGQLLVDDVTPLRPTSDGVVVEPFDRPLHLLDDAMERIDLSGTRRVAPDRVAGPTGKSVLSLDAGPVQEPAPVDRLVLLSAHDLGGRVPLVRPVTGAERLQRIVRHSNVTGLSSFGPRAGAYFAWATAVADALDVVEVRRDRSADTLDAVIEAVAGPPPSG